MRRSPAEDDALDQRPASPALLPRAIVNRMQFLKRPWFPIGIHVIPQRAAAMPQRSAERRLYSSIQFPHFIAAEQIRRPQRMNPGTKERLIHVNIPQPSNHRLIQ